MNVYAIVITEEQLNALIDTRVAAALAATSPAGHVADLVTVAEAARMAGVKPKTVRTWLSAGRLHAYGANRRRLISRTELEALIFPTPARPGRFADMARSGRALHGKAAE